VFVPRGDYRINGTLTVKRDVTMRGVFGGPPANGQFKGSCLLAFAGKGDENGTPFMTLEENATLRGLSIFYPEQSMDDIQPYPWTLRATGVNVSILDTLIVNPWQAVDLGNIGRTYINRLFGQPLRRGIIIDHCYDVGRIENIHFWPFWADDLRLHAFTSNNLESFIIGKTDWHYISNCFTIFAKIGFHFVKTKAGECNALINTSGSDVGPLAVQADQVMPHAGVSFVNCQFMSTINVSEENRGPLKFTNCGFWGVDERGAKRIGFPGRSTRSHATVRGTGHITFNTCHFNGWNRQDKNDPCINAISGGLTVNCCEFQEEWPNIVLGKDMEAVIIMGNRFNEESPKIENNADPKLCQIGMNVRAVQSGRKLKKPEA